MLRELVTVAAAAAPGILLAIFGATCIGLVVLKALQRPEPPPVTSGRSLWLFVGPAIMVAGAATFVFAQEKAASAQAAPSAMNDYAFKALLVTTLGGIVSSIVLQVFQLIKAANDRKEKIEQRKWDLEDRAAARAKAIDIARQQYEATVATAVEVTKDNMLRDRALGNKIDENTTLTRAAANTAAAAYSAANDFNSRMEELRDELKKAVPAGPSEVDKG